VLHNTFYSGYSTPFFRESVLETALEQCLKSSSCNAVTLEASGWTGRAGTVAHNSPSGETSYAKSDSC
jgi:hypothetical protein